MKDATTFDYGSLSLEELRAGLRNTPTVQDAVDDWTEIEAEHDAGEHFDAIVVDCPICAAEWQEITR